MSSFIRALWKHSKAYRFLIARDALRQYTAAVVIAALPVTMLPTRGMQLEARHTSAPAVFQQSVTKQHSAPMELPSLLHPTQMMQGSVDGSSASILLAANKIARARSAAIPRQALHLMSDKRVSLLPRAAMAGGGPPSNTSTITSNFNGTSIAAGDYVWFNSVMKVSGLGSSGGNIFVKGASIQFSANGVNYDLPIADATITFSSTVTSATTTFDAVGNRWTTSVPLSFSGNVFIAGLAYPVSTALGGGINPVTWTGTFYTDTSGVSLNWQWAAAVYTTFTSVPNSIGVKPIDGNTENPYANSDHAGTPENFKSYVTGGARGGGGSNWTGSYSGTANVTPTVINNQPPVANAGPNQTVFEDTTVHLDGTGSNDPDGDPLTYSWSFVSVPSGSAASLTGPNTPQPTFFADKVGDYTAQLIVSDGYVDSPPSQVVITTKNSPPVAKAGPNQTVSVQTVVQLDGSGSSDVDGDALAYQWTLISAPLNSAAVLSNPTAVRPTFLVDEQGSYTFQLVVNDGVQSSTPSSVTITTENSPPVANAGPAQKIAAGQTVHLDGSGSTDVDGDTLTYSWSLLSVPPGSAATLSSASAITPTFIADLSGTYIAQLVVNDGTTNSAPATVVITTGDTPPVANAGPAQTVTIGSQVTLNGTASADVDGDPLTYSWSVVSKPSGSNAALSGATTANPTFTVDVTGNYVIQLIVNDRTYNSAPATVVISTINSVPVADAGPRQSVIAGATVNLDGSGSFDADGNPLSYTWSILAQPSGGTASLSNPHTVKPSFVANIVGQYVAQLIVNDGHASSFPATVLITAASPDQPPNVSAGSNQTIELPTTSLTLDGSAVSVAPAGSPVTVQWSEVSGPATVTFANPTGAVTQASFPVVGSYVVQLTGTVTVSGLSSSAQATITVAPVNQPPVVNAGPNQTITLPTNTVTLSGSATDDGFPPGSTLRVSWSKVLGPGNVTFSNPSAAVTQAAFAVPGVYELQLSATDGQYTSTSDTTVTVNPPAGTSGALTVTPGPNQILTFPSNVTVGATVTDLLPPPGGSPSLQWSQVSGPGTATFVNPNSLSTGVNFNQQGVYDLRLTATDGAVVASGDVFVFLGHVQCTSGNKGTDFWLMFIGGVAALSQPDQELDLFVSGDLATTGTVSIPGIGFTQNFTVTPGQVAKVTVPQAAMVKTSDTIANLGIHVAAQNPVAVYGLNYIPAASDGYTGLPTTLLGTNYINLGYEDTHEGGAFPATTPGTEFGIVATQNNTTVTITPSITVDAFPTHLSNVPYTIQLNQGQTYQLRDLDQNFPNPDTGAAPIDLSGSTISSNKPIAVFGGHDCTVIPNDATACNHIVEELPPTNLWGQAFLTIPLAQETKGDTFRYLASVNGTHVSVNGTVVATLNRGQFFEQILTVPSFISADQPILVAQYANSNSFSDPGILTGDPTSTNFDPSMTLVPPFEQFGGSYTVSTPVLMLASPKPFPQTQGFQQNFVNVIAPTAVAQAGGVLLDGNPIPASIFVPVQNSGFSGAQVAVSVGAHHISSSAPLGLWSYGWDYFDAYSYTGGFCAASGLQSGTLALSPTTLSLQIPQQASIAATVTDAFGNPAGGVGVSFQVSGVNSSATTISTDATGTATFSYSSTVIGSDSITASAGVATGTASVQWLPSGPNQAPTVNAGPNQTIELPTNTVQLNATAHDDGLPIGSLLSFQWTMVSGPASVTFTTPAALSTSAAFTAPGTYVLQLAANDTQLTGTGTTQVTVYPVNQPPVVSAGPDQTVQLPTNAVALQGTATDDGLPPNSKVTVQWSQLSGPAAVTFSAPTQTTTQATFSAAGIYVLQLSASDTQLTSTSTVTVTVQQSDPTFVPPQVSAGPPQTIQLPVTTVTLNGAATDNGNPTGTTLTISWAQLSGPGGVVFSAPTQAVTQATFPGSGTYVLQISGNNGHFTSTSTTTITVLPVDVPPVVTVPPPQSIELPQNTVLLNGLVTDTTLPPGATLSIGWSEVSGPAGVSFGTPNNAATIAGFTTPGTYLLKLSATDGQLSNSATVTVTVYPVNQPPVVNAGAPQTFGFLVNLFITNNTVTLNGTASDDGMPPGSKLGIQWTEVSGPGSVTFSNPQSPVTTATFTNPGTYLLQLSASDGQFTSTSVTTVNALPVVINAGGPYNPTAGQPITLNGTITVGGQSVANSFVFTWAVLQQNPNFPPVFSPNQTSSVTPQVTFGGTGPYLLALCIGSTSGCDTASASKVTINVSAANAPPPPNVAIASPVDGAEVTKATTITGTAAGTSWTLSYAMEDDLNPENFVTLATGTGPVTNAALGTLDPTLLLNGTYALRLTSVDSLGQSTFATNNVTVTRNMKVGVLSISFNDMTVPIAGIPIQVIRSYDNRDKQQDDFGIGWRVSLTNIHIQKTHNIGLNWNETAQSSSFLPQYCLQQTNPAIVSLTFPDGKAYRFQETLNPSCQLAGPITAPTVTFTELPGSAGTNGAHLVPADGGSAVVDGTIPGPVNLLGFDGSVYNPTAFILTTIDGTKYAIDQVLGVTQIIDPNGNVLTFTQNGITSSAGKGLAFTRDNSGRITAITDPAGNSTRYSYDETNDTLDVFVDRSGNQTSYEYGANSNLTRVLNATGQPVMNNTYDASGRLTSTSNASGETQFTPNLSAQTETITDPLGNPTTYVYDNDGNIVQTTDALGNVTSATYDADDNKLTETNGLGKTTAYTYDTNDNRTSETDPLGNKASYTYNSFGKVLTTTDPDGNVTTNTYDANGNLLTTTDPLGKTTTNAYNPNGTLASTTDPLGHVTQFAYDSAGNLTSQTDANGTVTTYSYDGNGNRLTQSVTRTLAGGAKQTLLTQYQYDANNHLLKTTYPDGSSTQAAYNNLNQQGSTTDARGNVTKYQYDANGRLSQTNYPDGSLDEIFYDSDGHRAQFISRTGISTNYAYDKDGRLIKTTNQSTQGVTQTGYDAAGQAISSTDPLGHVTQYAYDAAGRRTQITDALNEVTAFAYDAAGNEISTTDALGHTTIYGYDSDNRQTSVTYADTTSESTAYDALGRVTSRTDANGKTTQYGYDALGRLISVTDALSQITRYAYDEVGDRISQTDANGHTTAFQYDQRGRRTSRTLPAGQSESFTYDGNGNVLTHTDFNGKTATYTYDAANRLLAKVPDASLSEATVTYTYSATGLRSKMTDASGTTSYSYAGGNYLSQEFTPEGQLNYTYDVAGNMTGMQVTGFADDNLTYTYDALNRVSTVVDSALASGAQATKYAYDAAGNLKSATYPNGVVHGYAYDQKNRLTNLGVNNSSGPIESYAYTLDNAGHRTSVTELSGRTVNYGYDNIYRLTSEAVASDPASNNGTVGYTYDPVGNRTQMSSTLGAVPAGAFSYDADDRLALDTYDPNGNTISSGGITNTYDFENHLIAQGGATIVYDGDGNRVQKTVGGVTTQFLVSTVNPTGYAQVVEESLFHVGSGAPQETRTFGYGLERLDQVRQASGQTQRSFYVYDGHGSVRALTDPTGNITDTYDYDAFGNLIHSTGSTPNEFLFAGEQYDSDLKLYYSRARYLNVTTGRFWTMDTFDGDPQSPLSLHKYLYAGADPVNRVDPLGTQDFDIGSLASSFAVAQTIASMSNVLVAGVYSALTKGLPDAVGFGAFIAGPESFGAPLIGGVEVLFAPREEREAVYIFGGIEPAVSGPLTAQEILGGHAFLERGAFAVWYWGLPNLSGGFFAIPGVSLAGGFIGQEFSGNGTTALLFGMSTDLDFSLFTVLGGAKEVWEGSLSERAMVAEAGAAETAFSSVGLVTSGSSVNGVSGLAAAIINGAAVATWVGFTYGKVRQQ